MYMLLVRTDPCKIFRTVPFWTSINSSCSLRVLYARFAILAQYSIHASNVHGVR